jgi:hypothetical protein
MQLAENRVEVAEVLDHVLEEELVEARVLERPGDLVLVMHDIRGGVTRHVHPDRAGVLPCAAAHVQDAPWARGAEIELRRVGGTAK